MIGTLFWAGYIGLMGIFWGLLWSGVPRWGEGWRIGRPPAPLPSGPSLSICIPARNEADNIGPCVKAALASRWRPLEVIVMNDASEDDTAQRAQDAADGDARLRLAHAPQRPAGWAGKPWACHNAAQLAHGAYLLFIDADVRLHPDAAQGLVETARTESLGMLSVFGTWELISFWERALIPAIGWLIRGTVDLNRVNDPADSRAFANGQCILFDRAVYHEHGGHTLVQGEVLEDVRLAAALKARGVRLGLRAGEWMFRVRLYRTLSEIIAGYSKNLYEGMGRNPVAAVLLMSVIAAGTLLPWGMVGWSLGFGWMGAWTMGFGTLCVLQVAFRWRLERRDGRSGRVAWAHPVANLVLIWVIARSMVGKGGVWKGRRFEAGRARD